MVTLYDINGQRSRPRHPEMAARPDTAVLPKPAWLRVRAPGSPGYIQTRSIVREHRLHTVCEEAACPNIGECWQKRHATMMIMGGICTRACAFCNVATGKPAPLDSGEPQRVADAVAELGLEHIVITSVDRDDLSDGGARHFAETIGAIRSASPGTTIEVLTPDFLRKGDALDIVIAARPDVFNHNLETVPRLYPKIRPGARYFHSLRLLQRAKEIDGQIFTKSGLMAGLGETREEVLQVMDDLRSANVDFLTIGQYLKPTRKHAAVERYVPPVEFDSYAQSARGKGFLLVSASPLTRSSYHAGDGFERRARNSPAVSLIEARSRHMPKFAANLSLLFTELPFLERFEAAAAAGFEGVEFLFPYEFDAADLAARLRANGLHQALFNMPAGNWAAGERGLAIYPNTVREFREGVDKAIRYAKALGCRQLHCLAGIAPAEADQRVMRKTYVENLKLAARMLADDGLSLLVEPINTRDIPGYFLDTSAKAVDIIESVDAPNLRLQYDVYHMQIMEGDLAPTISKHLKHIAHVQIADTPGRNEPGTGEINFPYIFDHLDRSGYQGWIGCEYRPRTSTYDSLKWFRALKKRSS